MDCTKYVNLTRDGITKEHRKTVDALVDKYGLTDVCSDYYGDEYEYDEYDDGVENWALNADTGEPVIYDYGV